MVKVARMKSCNGKVYVASSRQNLGASFTGISLVTPCGVDKLIDGADRPRSITSTSFVKVNLLRRPAQCRRMQHQVEWPVHLQVIECPAQPAFDAERRC